MSYNGRREGSYRFYPTVTGTLPQCLECGALVGAPDVHDRWHATEALRADRCELGLA